MQCETGTWPTPMTPQLMHRNQRPLRNATGCRFGRRERRAQSPLAHSSRLRALSANDRKRSRTGHSGFDSSRAEIRPCSSRRHYSSLISCRANPFNSFAIAMNASRTLQFCVSAAQRAQFSAKRQHSFSVFVKKSVCVVAAFCSIGHVLTKRVSRPEVFRIIGHC